MKEAHYDKIADIYSGVRKENTANAWYLDFQFQHIFSKCPVPLDNAVVLDNMAGSCEFADSVIKQVAEMHATDYSGGLLAAANPRNLPESRVVSDALQLPYAEAAYDAVFVNGGLHHVHDDVDRALKEIYRVLRPGGYAICTEPVNDNPLVHFMREQVLYRLSDLFEPGERAFMKADLVAAMKRVGFEEVMTHPMGYAAYILIANTDIFPLFRDLRSKAVVDALLWAEKAAIHTPALEQMALVTVFVGRKPPE